MPRVSIKAEGLDKAIVKADAMPGAFARSNTTKQAVKAIAAALKAKVKSNAPDGPTGNLRRGVKHSAQPHFIKGKVAPLQQFVYVDHRIAPHHYNVEFGHGGQKPAPPHPYFRPAVESSRGSANAQIRAALKAAITGIT